MSLQPSLTARMLHENTVPNSAMQPAAPPVLRDTRLLNKGRERFPTNTIACALSRHYVQWVHMFVKWHGLWHPRDMGQPEIEGFLAMLANELNHPGF